MRVIIIFLFVFTPILALRAEKEVLLKESDTGKIARDSKISDKNKKNKTAKNDKFIYWYYKNDPTGARAFHNPLQFIIEGGIPGGKTLEKARFGDGMIEVLKKLKNPFPLIDDYGWKKFIYYEFIPHKGKGGNWIPNYTWHLFGGGFRTRLMIEYYHYHNYSHPAVWGWATMYIMHLFNESTQQGDFLKLSDKLKVGTEKTENDTVDPLPDLLFFDWVGGVIFSYDPINRFMTKYLHLSEWSYQSQLNPLTNRILNNGQIYWMRYQLFDTPFSVNWISGAKITAPGFSYEYKKDHYLSFGFGLSVNKIAMDSTGNLIAGSTVYTMGFYYSIADNPILTVTYSMPDYKAMRVHPKTRNEYNSRFYVNLYPTDKIKIMGMNLGLSFIYDRETFFLGVTNAKWPVGFTFSNHKPEYY